MKAILVAVKLPDTEESEFESSLAELSRLVTTLGYQISARVTQARQALAPAAVLGEGKLKELAELTGGSGSTHPQLPRRKDKARSRRELQATESETPSDHPEAEEDAEELAPASDSETPKIDLVVVDHEVSPSQLRNLERATGTQVLDRTGVIIEIFHRHAQSPKAKLEVEIARLNYTAPRLRESPRGKERQQGRGAGEAAIELDRRKIRDRIAELREQIESLQRDEQVRRLQRKSARRVALVGYTNAGKSSWMRVLTASKVLVEDKLFATLDTTVRALHPETRPRILLSDTVGFIKKLPHDLVASFKSTLDEALEASLLLYVVDASDPNFESQFGVTREVLAEIGAGDVPSRVLLNKIDRVAEHERDALHARFPDAWFVSAKRPDDVNDVRNRIIRFFEASYVEGEFLVPYSLQRLVSKMHDAGSVLAESYDDEGVRVRLKTDPATLEWLRSELRE